MRIIPELKKNIVRAVVPNVILIVFLMEGNMNGIPTLVMEKNFLW